MRELVDVHFPKAKGIRVVLDDLSTHTTGALYQAFPPAEARRLLDRLEFHYVPKHASWLDMVEIEIGVLAVSAWIGASIARNASCPKSMPGSGSATHQVILTL